MPRFDQKSRIELAPQVVIDAIRRELDKPDGERSTCKQLAYRFGFSKSTIGRYKFKYEKEKIKNFRLNAITRIELKSLRVITQFPTGEFVISTAFGRNSCAINTAGKVQYIDEAQIHPRDIRVSIRFVKGIVGNPDAIGRSSSTKVPVAVVPDPTATRLLECQWKAISGTF